MLRELEIEKNYITYGDNNIRNKLIVPALREAKLYRRSVGFFSASVFDTILDGISELSRNNGHIQIIASPLISKGDVEAIQLGYKLKEDVIKDTFLFNLDEALKELSDDKLKLAAELVARDILDIKVTNLKNDNSSFGLYHDKLGIITDSNGDSVVFVGSPNETINGLEINYEKVRVFKTWESVQDEYAFDEISEFESLWDGTNSFLETYAFKDAVNKHIIQSNEQRQKSAQKSSGKNVVTLRRYQEEAIENWKKNDFHGFFVMATGTGKTWTAIFAIKALQEVHKCLTIICAPYIHLVKQWSQDVESLFGDADVILVSSENPKWEEEITNSIIRNKIDSRRKTIIITTIVSFNLDRFQNAISKSSLEKLLIVDEAHRFTKRDDDIKEKFNYLLGLSATPFSGKEMAKGIELMQFFGGKVYDLPIEKALKDNFLVPYNYYPIYVHATEDEEKRFKDLSVKIMGCFNKAGICINSDNLVKYLRARLRLLAMAEEKIENIDSIINEVDEKDHLIVYCGDGKIFDDNEDDLRHINFVKQALSSHGYKASQFTASENMEERMNLVEMFDIGMIQSLAAIRCLDEGINIPSIKAALILASNDDYREFTQRRGRILRKYGNKDFANIYDVIVLPSKDTNGIAKIEFRRFYEYAKLAMNSEDLITELEDLLDDFNLNYDDIEFNYDIVQEAELDE